MNNKKIYSLLNRNHGPITLQKNCKFARIVSIDSDRYKATVQNEDGQFDVSSVCMNTSFTEGNIVVIHYQNIGHCMIGKLAAKFEYGQYTRLIGVNDLQEEYVLLNPIKHIFSYMKDWDIPSNYCGISLLLDYHRILEFIIL